jgi:hypothetical protein
VTLQFGTSLTDDTRSINYDRNTFIIQATVSVDDEDNDTFDLSHTNYSTCN